MHDENPKTFQERWKKQAKRPEYRFYETIL